MSNISAVGNAPSFISSSNFAARINWGLVGKVSLIATAVFLLAAALCCIGVRYSLRNELTQTQREHSQPLTEARRQEWLARARIFLWPEISPEEALVAASNALAPLQGEERRTIGFDAPSIYYLINQRLDDPVFQANPQRAWNEWRLHRGDAEYACPDDSASSFFERELGFTTSPDFNDLYFLRNYRYYRHVPNIDTTFSARMKALIRVYVRSLFGMS